MSKLQKRENKRSCEESDGRTDARKVERVGRSIEESDTNLILRLLQLSHALCVFVRFLISCIPVVIVSGEGRGGSGLGPGASPSEASPSWPLTDLRLRLPFAG